jgi:hypothetical protein
MPTTTDNNLDEIKVDILKHAYTSEAEWIRERREREYQVFAWTNSVLLLVIGAFIVVNPTNKNVLDIFDKVALSAAMIVLTTASYIWQRRSRNQVVAGARILSRILDNLRLREPGYFGEEPVFPPLEKKTVQDTWRQKVGLTLYSGTTVFMATLACVVIWAR